MQDDVITGIVSFTYRLHELQEPTFASLRLDPHIFVGHFQGPTQPLESHQVDIQLQPQAAGEIPSTHGWGEPNAGGEGGAVSGSVDQPVNTSEGGVGRTTDVVAGVGDAGVNGEVLAIEPPAGTVGVPDEDFSMEA